MSTRNEFIQAQSRATELLHALGDAAGAPAFCNGESLIQYRQRLASGLQKFCRNPQLQKLTLSGVSDVSAFAALENMIFDDASSEARAPTMFRPGELRAIVRTNPAGVPITKYVGDPNACWNQFNPPYQYVRRFLTPGTPRA